jgi:hypothetical protein
MPDDAASATLSLPRLFRYAPGAGFAGPHTDPGFLTLCVADGSGLQLRGAGAGGDGGSAGDGEGGGVG